jgi:excisionase family DNA binding protein
MAPAGSNATGGRLLNAPEAAELLGVKPSWVLTEARAGRLPHVRLGRYVRFRQDSLEEWLARQERGPAKVPPNVL